MYNPPFWRKTPDFKPLLDVSAFRFYPKRCPDPQLSRTIAELAGDDQIKNEHLAEAIQYRSLDRERWAG
ncbi:MAG: hypothetical protein JKY52_09800 [Flavobacteriales bacterium]|nr:hypothetical protein [Flavobacteriales bacterium]